MKINNLYNLQKDNGIYWIELEFVAEDNKVSCVRAAVTKNEFQDSFNDSEEKFTQALEDKWLAKGENFIFSIPVHDDYEFSNNQKVREFIKNKLK